MTGKKESKMGKSMRPCVSIGPARGLGLDASDSPETGGLPSSENRGGKASTSRNTPLVKRSWVSAIHAQGLRLFLTRVVFGVMSVVLPYSWGRAWFAAQGNRLAELGLLFSTPCFLLFMVVCGYLFVRPGEAWGLEK